MQFQQRRKFPSIVDRAPDPPGDGNIFYDSLNAAVSTRGAGEGPSLEPLATYFRFSPMDDADLGRVSRRAALPYCGAAVEVQVTVLAAATRKSIQVRER